MSRRGVRPVNERLRRLLVMLPWLQEQGTVGTREMAERFGLSVDELIADLTLASLCGVSEDPRDLIDLWVDEDEVHFGVPKYFERPLRLTLPEAFSLIASAEAARQIVGSVDDDVLSRAIAKVAAAVGPRSAEVAVDLEVPDSARRLATVAGSGRVVHIDYWNVDTGETSVRSIVPFEVFSERDHWYVRSVDIDVESERIFRVDRIESVRESDDFRDYTLPPRGDWFAGSADAVDVTIAIDPSYAWVLENYPNVRAVNDSESRDFATHVPDGWSLVRVVVTGERWLQRVLVRLGPHGRVMSPNRWADLASTTARSVRARYLIDNS